MSLKIQNILLFLTFQTILHLSSANIFKPTTTIRLGKRLEPGDIITVAGYFSYGGTEASFDLENDHCDWPTRKLSGCVEYDLFVQFHTNKIYRRININGNWKHHIDTYYPRFMKQGKFKYVVKVKTDNFEATLDGHQFAPLNFTEPIESLSLFRVYGFAIVESFNIEYGNSIY